MTASEDSQASLPSTHASLIWRAAHDPQALDEFVRLYWRPMRHFLVRLWGKQAQAEDVVQEFFLEKLRDGKLLEQFDPAKGHFRPFLKTALKNFAIGFRRREPAQKYGLVSLDDASVVAPAAEQEAADVFDVEWARVMIKQTEQRMRSQCPMQQWQVFLGRLWAPLTRGAAVAPYEDLRRQLGLPNTKDVANVLVNAKRSFHDILRSVVSESTPSSDEVQDEMDELLRVLDSRPAAEWARLLGDSRALTSPITVASCGTAPSAEDQNAAAIFAASPGKTADVSPAADDQSLDVMDSSALATALQIDVDAGLTAEDLAEILEFHLSTSVSDFLGLQALRRRRRTGGASFPAKPMLGDLLQQTQPALDQLEQVKRIARKESTRRNAAMPRRIAEAIYFTSIAVALVRCGETISSRPPNSLRSGFDFLLSCEWLPPWQREIVLAARQRLESHG